MAKKKLNSPSQNAVAGGGVSQSAQDQWVLKAITDLGQDIRDIRADSAKRSERVDECFEKIHGKLDIADNKVGDKIEAANVAILGRLDSFDNKLDGQDNKFGKLGNRLTGIETKIARIGWIWTGAMITFGLLFALYKFAALYVDVRVTPIEPAAQISPDNRPNSE